MPEVKFQVHFLRIFTYIHIWRALFSLKSLYPL